MQKEMNKGDMMVSKSVLGFIAELTNIGVFNQFKFLKLLTDLVNHAETSQKESVDFYLDLAVYGLVIALEKLMKIVRLECKNMITNISEILQKRSDVILMR